MYAVVQRANFYGHFEMYLCVTKTLNKIILTLSLLHYVWLSNIKVKKIIISDLESIIISSCTFHLLPISGF